MEWYLVLAVLSVAAVGAIAFWIGDRRRRDAIGATGPRPAPSVGEALERVPANGTVLVLLLGDEAAALQLRQALAEDPILVGLLEKPALEHVVVRADREGPEVVTALREKYGGERAPSEGSWALVLDAEGELRTALPATLEGLISCLRSRLTPGGGDTAMAHG